MASIGSTAVSNIHWTKDQPIRSCASDTLVAIRLRIITRSNMVPYSLIKYEVDAETTKTILAATRTGTTAASKLNSKAIKAVRKIDTQIKNPT
jgi:hypothetical protein